MNLVLAAQIVWFSVLGIAAVRWLLNPYEKVGPSKMPTPFSRPVRGTRRYPKSGKR